MKWPKPTQATGRKPPAQDAAHPPRAACVLCGYRPGEDGPDEPMRRLGVEPLAVLVCADLDRCVARFAAR